MSNTEKKEHEAIQTLVHKKSSSGYLRAINDNHEVMVLKEKQIVRIHNEKEVVVGTIPSTTEIRHEVGTYTLK